MSAIDSLFERLRAEGRKALMPFLTAGDPDLEFTAAAIETLARRGCSLFEIGFPYSDPIADGPVIQASYTRALSRRIRVADIFRMLRQVASRVEAPRVAMVSYAIVLRYGLERFVDEAQAAGLSGAIVPDLLVDECGPLQAVCRQRDFSLIQLVTPTTPKPRALRIAEASSGFVYYVSVAGITGERRELPPELADNIRWLRERICLPVCVGFGVSQPEHVRRLAPAADGVIVGSALVRRIAAADRPRDAVLQELARFVDSLVAALPAPAENG